MFMHSNWVVISFTKLRTIPPDAQQNIFLYFHKTRKNFPFAVQIGIVYTILGEELLVHVAAPRGTEMVLW